MDDDILLALGVFAASVGFWLGALVTAYLFSLGGPSDMDRGRCIGWAEAQDLVPAWDRRGECVLGTYPAVEVAHD